MFGNKLTLLALLFLVSVTATGQTKKALITGHFHYHLEDDPAQFDLSQHFENQQWTNSIGEETISLIKSQLNLENVEYHKAPGPIYLSDYTPGTAGFDDINNKNAHYFARIMSSLRISGGQSYSAWGENLINYVMLLKIEIKNSDGKKAFNKTIRLPFQARAKDYLYGPLISREDFYRIYSDALNGAFSGRKKLAKRKVNYGRNKGFGKFLDESHSYTVLNRPKTKFKHHDRFVNGVFVLVDNENNSLGQITISGTRPNPEFTEFFNQNLSNRLLQTSQLKNSITGNNYTITAGLSTSLDLEFERYDLEIPRVIVWAGHEQVGKFQLEDTGKFEGEFKGENYTAYVDNSLNLFELNYWNELKGVIQFGSYDRQSGGIYRDNAHFKKGLSKDEIGALVSFYFFARIADYIKLKAIAEEEGED